MDNILSFPDVKKERDEWESSVWECGNCGCQLFYLNPKYITCSECECVIDNLRETE